MMTTRQGNKVLTFAVFIVIAALFWFLMTLNDNVERDYWVRVNLEDVPEDINFVITPPEYINVNVKGKGSDMLRYDIMGAPSLNVKFDDMERPSSNTANLGAAELRRRIRRLFSGDDYLLTITPDSLVLTFTGAPGRRMAVKAVSDVKASASHIVYGTPLIMPDSVTVYSVKPLPDNMKYLTTSDIVADNVSDSLRVSVAVKVPDGTRVEPADVDVVIPVEPLVARTRDIVIEPAGVPAGYRLSTFPNMVRLSVMVPMSLYANDDTPVKVYADYNKRVGNVIPLTLSILPEYYRNATLDTRRVEFILEHNQ